MGLLNDTILNALESLKVNYKPALAGEIYYASGCGCTGNCGQSCSGGCETGCSGNCGRSCSGSGSWFDPLIKYMKLSSNINWLTAFLRGDEDNEWYKKRY